MRRCVDTHLEKINQDVSDALQVVAPGLLDAEVVVDGGVTGGARERPTVTVGDVLQVLGVAVALREAKVDAVDVGALVAKADDEVGRLDVPVDEVPRVQGVDALEQLVGDLQHGFEGEASGALVE